MPWFFILEPFLENDIAKNNIIMHKIRMPDFIIGVKAIIENNISSRPNLLARFPFKETIYNYLLIKNNRNRPL